MCGGGYYEHKGDVLRQYFPTPIKIPALSFMEKGFESNSHWHELNKEQFIQRLLTRNNNEQCTCVVTIEPELEDANIHNRWPRIVQFSERID